MTLLEMEQYKLKIRSEIMEFVKKELPEIVRKELFKFNDLEIKYIDAEMSPPEQPIFYTQEYVDALKNKIKKLEEKLKIRR